jgi:hypothetical protein
MITGFYSTLVSTNLLLMVLKLTSILCLLNLAAISLTTTSSSYSIASTMASSSSSSVVTLLGNSSMSLVSLNLLNQNLIALSLHLSFLAILFGDNFGSKLWVTRKTIFHLVLVDKSILKISIYYQTL